MILISILVLPVALICAELVARITIHRGGYYVFAPGKKEHLTLDQSTHPQLPATVRMFANGAGERGSELPSSSNLYRGLVVGGSAVESYLLDQEVVWPQALQQLLSTPDNLSKLGVSAVHIGNVGRSGVDSSTLEYILDKILPNYRTLDLMVIMVGASDVLRWLESGAPSDTSASTMPVNKCFGRHPEIKLGYKPKELGLVELVRRERIKKLNKRDNAARWFKKARTMRANAKNTIQDTPDPKVIVEAFNRHFPSLLLKAQKKAKRVIVVRQPWFKKDSYLPQEESLFWNGGIGKAYQDELTDYFSSQVISNLMGVIDREAREICARQKIEQLDLMPLITSDVSNYIDQFHFTPKASLEIAEHLRHMIVEQQKQ